MRRASIAALAATLALLCACRTRVAPAPDVVPEDKPRPTQRLSAGAPPAAPDQVRVDPGAALPAAPAPAQARDYVLRRIPESVLPPASADFNPDPGAAKASAAESAPGLYSESPVPLHAAAPTRFAAPERGPLERTEIVQAPTSSVPEKYGAAPLPDSLRLPRSQVREDRFLSGNWTAPDAYSGSAQAGAFPGAAPVADRWSVGFVPWRRYTSGDTDEMPYFHSDPEFWHYYRQSTLKGDRPIRGQDLFLRVTASADVTGEERALPVPSLDSAARAESSDFYGQSRSQLFTSDLALEFDLFKGDTVFKPVDWLIHIKPVFNTNYVAFQETGEVSPDPRGSLSSGSGSAPSNGSVTNPGDVGSILGGLTPASGSLGGSRSTTRSKTYGSLQEAFVEKHLGDLSSTYDFCALAVGNQTFNSDFRGFIFNDTNLGARFFGNYEDNRWQYNLALFDLREKDTNSGLNTFQRRGQLVAVANLYREDSLIPGYTTEVSVLGSFDQSGTQYDTNGFLVRPEPIGSVRPHRVDSYYFGLTGDGHAGRWNVTDAAYLVTGHDEFNGLAGMPVTILAGMAALELSYDRDWIRYKASVFYASGDHSSQDGKANGFDSIEDNTNFTGGPFSYWVRQSFNLGGTAVPLKQRFSLLPDLRAGGAFEGQSNFVNPGLILYGVGAEADLTPKIRAFFNANYLQFDTTDPIKRLLMTNEAGRSIGMDISLGFQWRPLLISNVILSAGCGVLLPAAGYRNIYSNTVPSDPGFTPAGSSGKVDQFLYSAILAGTFTY
ncbi:MAG TPA: hypothetical protein VFE25_16150 [Opitutaceae bacterium]|jgi:hypothetical protein|nr:hypothetical protein [Opitutaceae bacterium]